jgi:hypothetical protein
VSSSNLTLSSTIGGYCRTTSVVAISDEPSWMTHAPFRSAREPSPNASCPPQIKAACWVYFLGSRHLKAEG